MNNLTFNRLRKANAAREEYFVRKVGAGFAFDRLSAWSNATLGELGEAANIVKKIERGDFNTPDELARAYKALAKELADVQIYLDLYARHAGIDLAEATVSKWNEVCERYNVPMRLEADHDHDTD